MRIWPTDANCHLVRLQPAELLKSTQESVGDFESLYKGRKFRVLDGTFSVLMIAVTSDLSLMRKRSRISWTMPLSTAIRTR